MYLLYTIRLSFLLFCLTVSLSVFSQHTFSIVAVNHLTGEVGSAGATCLSSDDCGGCGGAVIITDVVPGKGAMNSQAVVCIPNVNLQTGITKINEGFGAQEVIDFVVSNDSCIWADSTYRQYGVALLKDDLPEAAGYTGVNATTYANHNVGINYSIQGNILLGQQVLDGMEQGFLNTEGTLAHKLMGAMQGANLVGADQRCTQYGTSSLSSFLKVAKPTDNPDSLYIDLLVPSTESFINPDDLSEDFHEPIDSLQSLFNQVELCELLAIDMKVFMEGFYDSASQQHSTELVSKNLLPNNQPFNTMPWNYNGTETLSLPLADISDWVLITIRDINGTILNQKACLVDNNGVVKTTTGESRFVIDVPYNEQYIVSVSHKGHLTIGKFINESESIDFSQAGIAMGIQQTKNINGVYVMHSGDYNNDGNVNVEDFNSWKQNSATLNQYLNFDADCNGIVNVIDYNLWVNNKSKLGEPVIQY